MRSGENAIKNHAYALTIEAGADHFSVRGCFRLNPHRMACHVTVYGIPTTGPLVDCSFYGHAFWQGHSRRIHLGDTRPVCRAE